MFLFIFFHIVKATYDRYGVEYDNAQFTVLISTSLLTTSSYTVPASCEIIDGGNAFVYSSFRGSNGKLTDLNFEEGSQLKCIYPYVFSTHSSLLTLNLSNCDLLSSINKSLCESCPNLKTLILPNHIKSIGGRAFYNCRSLASINIPDEVQTIETNSFTACKSIKTFHISETSQLKKLGGDALQSTSITEIYFPKSFSEIGGAALLGTKLDKIYNQKSQVIYSYKNDNSMDSFFIYPFTSLENEMLLNGITNLQTSFANTFSFKQIYKLSSYFEDSYSTFSNKGIKQLIQVEIL